MEKPAPVDHPVHELIRRRWSPRAFGTEPVTPEQVLTLLEAARWAASCFNDQPWSFLVGFRDDETWQGIHDCLVPGNQAWAAAAPVLLLSVANEMFVQTGKPNRHAQHDTGQAAAHLALQATEVGLCVHQMAGFDAEAARKRFSIPPDQTPMAAIAVGPPGDADALPEALAERERAPRERVPVSTFTFTGTWGRAAPFASRDAPPR